MNVASKHQELRMHRRDIINIISVVNEFNLLNKN